MAMFITNDVGMHPAYLDAQILKILSKKSALLPVFRLGP